MKVKNGVIFLLTISLLTVFSGCGKDKAVSNVMTLATSFSAQEAEAYLADFDFDYQKQSEKDIKSSKDETIRKLSDYKIKYTYFRACKNAGGLSIIINSIRRQNRNK